MKVYIIIIQLIFAQQFFFAHTVKTYNKPAVVTQPVAENTTPSVSDSTRKVIDINRIQTIGKFPNLYPDVKHTIKSMVEPEVTGFFETACVNAKKYQAIN